MNRCSIFEFRNAVTMPTLLLAKLRSADMDHTSLTRTRYFAECCATIDDDEINIYAPLEDESLHLAHRANLALQRPYREGFVRLEILDNEMQHTALDDTHATISGRCTLIVERMPEGNPLMNVINSMSRQELLLGLEELDARLKHHDISHNNLKLENIIVDNYGRWHPIRQYYTCRGYGGDSNSFEMLREIIYKYTTPLESVDISKLEPWCNRPTVELDALLEGRRQLRTAEGIGFEDESGEVVIAPQYLWASDFMENRATVRNRDNRMGVIDRMGKEIIPTIYDSVEYSVESGKSIVRCNGLVAIFDYNGLQITPWHERDSVVTESQQ